MKWLYRIAILSPLYALIAGVPVNGAPTLEETLTNIETLLGDLDRTKVSGQAQIDFLERAENSSASDDERLALDTQIGALQIEMRNLARQREQIRSQLEALRTAIKAQSSGASKWPESTK